MDVLVSIKQNDYWTAPQKLDRKNLAFEVPFILSLTRQKNLSISKLIKLRKY